MDEFDHLLSRHGILSNFHVAKKVKIKDINKIKESLMESCDGDEDEVNRKLEQLILLQTKSSINKEEIPGLIINGKQSKKRTKRSTKSANKIPDSDPFNKIPIKIKKTLTGMAFYFTDLIKEEKLTKEQILILIQLIISMNDIQQRDITRFQKKYKKDSNIGPDYLNNEEYDDDEDDDLE